MREGMYNRSHRSRKYEAEEVLARVKGRFLREGNLKVKAHQGALWHL